MLSFFARARTLIDNLVVQFFRLPQYPASINALEQLLSVCNVAIATLIVRLDEFAIVQPAHPRWLDQSQTVLINVNAMFPDLSPLRNIAEWLCAPRHADHTVKLVITGGRWTKMMPIVLQLIAVLKQVCFA